MAKDRKIDMVILGLLAHEDLTGYDIKKRIDGAISLFWKGILAALIIGVVGITSINRNAQNSEVVSLVNQISVLQSENLANDALYQYYVDETVKLADTAAELKRLADSLKDDLNFFKTEV